jgi:hypothetical protein
MGREGLVGMIGGDTIGRIRRAYFEQDRTIKEMDAVGIAHDGAQGHSNLQGLWIRAYGRVKQRI